MSRQAHIALLCGSVALIDAEDLTLVAGWRWYRLRRPDGEPSYVVGERSIDGVRERVTLSRLVMGIDDARLVDHRHGDLLDNRKAELRVCDHGQNMRNRKVARTNKLGLKGVHLAPDGRRYRAAIGINGRSVSLGGFSDPLKAARAYDRAAIEHFGEFARLNFPPHRDWLFPHEHAEAWPPAA